MKIMLVNGSPKPGASASGALLGFLAEQLGPAHECVVYQARQADPAEFLAQARDCQAIVITFPLYVDGLPSHLLRLLDETAAKLSGAAPAATLYAVANNGFYEAKQNRPALLMLRQFAAAAGLRWGRGLGVGAGGMIGQARLGHGPMTAPGQALTALAADIGALATGEDAFVEPNFPRALYKMMAHIGWRLMARKNGLKGKALYARRS